MQKVVDLALEFIDVPKLISLTLNEYTPFQEIGMTVNIITQSIQRISAKALSNANQKDKDIIDIQFHVHIPYIIESAKSIIKSNTYRNAALQTLTNLANRDYLRPYITYNDGLSTFIDGLRSIHNPPGRRIAAKGLITLCEKDSKILMIDKLRLRVLAELSEEIRQTWIHDADSVVAACCRVLLRAPN